MDPEFWGPSAWKLLHSISYAYKYALESSIAYSNFLKTIPFILPCKYCRSSLIDYYKEHPFQIFIVHYLNKTNQTDRSFLDGSGIMNPKLNMPKWMYTIHNCVNNKLRKQGLPKPLNPSYSEVEKHYAIVCKQPWNVQLTQYWNFLFSVGYNHPKKKHRDSTPMPNCPSGIKHSKDKCEKNKWNVLSLKDKNLWYRRFWEYLPAVLPAEIALHWKEAEAKNPPNFKSQTTVLYWLWNMRCTLDTTFKESYPIVCKQYKIHYTAEQTLKTKKTLKTLKTKKTKKTKKMKKTLKIKKTQKTLKTRQY